MSKFKKVLLIVSSSIVVIAIVVIVFISPITKYLIEKYDEKYTGRQITLDWAYVNPFTGYIHLNDLKIHEQNSDSIFFSTNGLTINIEIIKLFSKTYEISECTLDNPRGVIIQNKKDLNFNDLIEKFSPKGNANATKSPQVKFNILNVKIKDGEFYYHEKVIPINYSIKNVNIESAGKRWDSDTISAAISFLAGIGSGSINGSCTINLKNEDYSYAAVVQKYDLNIIEQYLKALTNYGSLSANLDANIRATGNFKDEEDLSTKGMFAINDFHFGKNPKEDYASFDKAVLAIKEVGPKRHIYLFDSVSITHPYVKYERYDHLDNLQTIFGKRGANVKSVNADPEKFNLIIEIANYIKTLSKNFFQSNYKITRLGIYNGDLRFSDFSISEKFSAGLSPLYVISDSIDKNHKRVNASFNSNIKPFGKISVALSINPKDEGDFDMQYHMQKLPVALFNPYIISYTSFPLDRGTMEFKGAWNVRNGIIQSDNHMVILDPRVTKRVRNKDTKWIPVPLIMAFIRERGNVIDYEIPITGNLKNPKFHLCDVLTDLIENIFIKPATTPYRIQVKNDETEIEKSMTLKWKMRSSSLEHNQEKFVKKIADFLVKNPEVSIVISPKNYSIKEKEYILFFEAKKKYFLAINHINKKSFSESDSILINKMSAKDSLFVQYLNKQLKDPMLFTIQDKCSRYIGSEIVNSKYTQLKKERASCFMFYFKKNNVEKQIKLIESENIVPYNGFSFYKIEYKGDLPESLTEAFNEMNQFNDEAPRKKFEKERKRNKTAL